MKFLPPYHDKPCCRESGISERYEHLKLSSFEGSQTEGPFGRIISQNFRSKGYALYRHYFFMLRPTNLYLVPAEGMLAISYMLKGSPVVQLRGTGALPLPENTFRLFYLPPFRQEIRFEAGEYQCIHAAFDASLLNLFADIDDSLLQLQQQVTWKSEQILSQRCGRIDASVQRMLHTAMRPKLHQGNMALHTYSVVTQLLLQYLNRCYFSKKGRVPKAISESIMVAKEYIHDHIDEPLTLEYLGRISGASASSLKRYFSAVTGIPLSRYLLQCKMKRAMEYLSMGHNVSETALMLGYSSLSSFCRVFTGYHQISPGQVARDHNHA